MSKPAVVDFESAQLSRNQDYLWCPVCQIHVPCSRIPAGGWEVDCPGCVGECLRCKCYLKRFCFGGRDQFPPFEPGEGGGR
jgi:hypothetical protein